MTEQTEHAEIANDVSNEVLECPCCAKRRKWRAKMRSLIVRIIIFISVLLLVIAFMFPMFCDYTTRTRVSEGLVLASTAKNIVTDNAVNGFPFIQGWKSIPPTKNTQVILIDEQSGIIFIISNPKSTQGGVVLTLTPTQEEGKPLVSGELTKGRITWECKTLILGSRTMRDIPAECRTMME